jgi:hypothetical protein
MKLWFVLFTAAVLSAGCQNEKDNADRHYVLSVSLDVYAKGGTDALVEKAETDTVQAPSPLAAYSKGVQKYAAVLMHIQQYPDSIKSTKELRIFDEEGNNVVPAIPQAQRDSVIMNFIQFARRSDIPYYERVKDFELKLMKVR